MTPPILQRHVELPSERGSQVPKDKLLFVGVLLAFMFGPVITSMLERL